MLSFKDWKQLNLITIEQKTVAEFNSNHNLDLDLEINDILRHEYEQYVAKRASLG